MPTNPQRYPLASRSEAVELARTGDKHMPQVARHLGIHEQTLRNCVKQAEIDAWCGSTGDLNTVERAELVWHRRENRVLQREHEFLNTAMATFAETTL